MGVWAARNSRTARTNSVTASSVSTMPTAETQGIDAEGPGLAGALQRRDEGVGSREDGRAVEHSAMDVREEEPASGGGGRDVPQGPIDRVLGEVVGHSLPEPERARSRIEAG